MKTIEVVISPAGEVVVETKGYRGKECRAASRPFEEALGVTTNDRPTAEAALSSTMPTVKQ